MIITDGHEYEARLAQRGRHTSRLGRLALWLLGFRGNPDPWEADPTHFGTAYHGGISHMRAVHHMYEHEHEHEQSHEHETLDEHLHELLHELEHLHAHLHEHEHPHEHEHEHEHLHEPEHIDE